VYHPGRAWLRSAHTFSVDEIRALQAKDLGSPGSDESPDKVIRSIPGGQPADALPAALRVAYQRLDGIAPSPAGVLAAIRFGAKAAGLDQASGHAAPTAALTIDVSLDPLLGPPSAELWFAGGPVHTGQWSDPAALGSQVRFAHDEHYLFAVIELDERHHGGILLTAERAYASIRQFQQQSVFPHLLRMWNYMDAINEGTGDMERYRQFCVGRGRGLGDVTQSYPSATAIGRHHADHLVQVFWLAAKAPGQAVENPRQISAYQYPRVYGPVSPTFSRALVAPDSTVLISGTASIVGHISQHHDDAMEQLEETVRNLTAFNAHISHRRTSASRDLLKVYVRDPALTPRIAARLGQLYPGSEIIFVAADICRRELLLEIEAVMGT
jgi:chorismate lyase / 3-hydroxybenzoate synthase